MSDYRYGSFGPDGMAFVVSDPATPRAFDNVLWNDAVMSCVQQTGVGYCDIQIDGKEAIQVFTGIGRVCDLEAFGRDHLMSRLVYVRDNDTGEFWNVGWEPVRRGYEAYACEHGLGRTEIRSQTAGIASALLLFVPPGSEPAEWWRLRVTNVSGRRRALTLFIYNQYTLQYKWGFHSYGDMIYRGAWYDEAQNAMVVQKHPYVAPHAYLTAFLTADRQADGFDGSRDFFVGTYNTLQAPQAVVQGRCTNTRGSSDATIGVLQFNVTLQAGAQETIRLVHGLTDDPKHIAGFRRRCFEGFEAGLAGLEAEKAQLVQRNAVTTPDAQFNRLANGWLKQQALFGATWCRWGWMGYRDIVQHGFGVSSFAPARTRRIILEALRHVTRSGVAVRGWNPIDSKPYSDSTLWLIFTLDAYLKETGDVALLEERVAYLDGGEDAVREHLATVLDCFEQSKGAHGLCLIRFGDWNDSLTGIGKEGRGESVWLSMAYAHALRVMGGLYAHLGDAGRAAQCEARYEAMRRAVHDQGWDGEWFRRCYDDAGQPVGSRANAEGQFFIEPQGWAVIAGIADAGQVEALLRSCDARLLTEVGYRLLVPPFLTRNDYIGRISYLEPGICENGTIYAHCNAWMLLALLMLGRGDKAYDLFRRIAPGFVAGADGPKQWTPPYVFANCHYAPEHRNRPLQTEFTWITGSVAWFYHAIMEYWIGIRREYDGLTVDPVLPQDWDHVTATREFRGKRFEIEVRRTGAYALALNGRRVDGKRLRLAECGERNEVRVTV